MLRPDTLHCKYTGCLWKKCRFEYLLIFIVVQDNNGAGGCAGG